MNTAYEISNEIKDDLQIGTYCQMVRTKDYDNKKYKIYTLDYYNYQEHLVATIKNAFNNKTAYNKNNEFIDDKDIKDIAFNILFIMLYNTSRGPLLRYVTSIFEDEFAFNILTSSAMLEEDLNLFLEKELNMELFVIDAFNKFDNSIDLIVKGK